MICTPCRNTDHDTCIDKMRAPEPVDTRGKPLTPRSTTCLCQHKVPVKPEPATGPAGE
jgi:hypothetical protein